MMYAPLFMTWVMALSTGMAQSALTYPCNQSILQLAATGNIALLAFGVRDLGHIEICAGLPDSRFCTSTIRMMCVRQDRSQQTLFANDRCATAPFLGLCVTSDTTLCPTSLLESQFINVTRHSAPFQELFGPNSPCAQDIPSDCINESYGFVDVDCMDNIPSFTEDKPAVIVFSFLMVLLTLCVFGTLIGAVRRWGIANHAAEEHNLDHAPHPMTADVKVHSREIKKALSSALHHTPMMHGKVAKAEEDSDMHVVVVACLSVLQWFDLFENFVDVMSVKVRHSTIDTGFFEGIRTIAMLFVIYGHSFYPVGLYGYTNMYEVAPFLKGYGSIGMFPADLAVDTFLFLSGFLFMHLYMKHVEKASSVHKHVDDVVMPLNDDTILHDDDTLKPHTLLSAAEIILMYVHRYLRMTPVVMITMVTSTWLLQYIPHASLFMMYRDSVAFTDCRSQWWMQLFYLTNLKLSWMNCMSWFWYLSCDFQLFVVAPLICGWWYRNRQVWLVIVCGGIAAAVGMQAHFHGYIDENWYHKTFVRFSPYFFGIAAAACVPSVLVKQYITGDKRIRYVIYVIAVALLTSSINLLWRQGWCNVEVCTDGFLSFVNAYVAFAWGMGLLLVCVCWCPQDPEDSGPVKRFLSHPAFIVASKLTFCCYMLHPVVMIIVGSERSTYPTFYPLTHYTEFSGLAVVTFFSALILHIGVEVPFARMNDAMTKH